MELNNQYRMRVRNCIGTIIDVQKSISEQYGELQCLAQFEELKQALEGLDMSLVCEADVLMVEKATNELLREFRIIFERGKVGQVYGETAN